jgi:hypothetical protein
MRLYTKELLPNIAQDACRLHEATLDDIKAFLADRGMITVNVPGLQPDTEGPGDLEPWNGIGDRYDR